MATMSVALMMHPQVALMASGYRAGRTLVTVEDHARPSAASPGPAAEPGSALLADAGGGHGLTAMRERAQRAGGTARAGPTADGWLVELDVPA
jgi:signal transduction histidine kinase